MDDEDIHKIAFQAGKIDSLTPEEHELSDDTPIVAGYNYIGKRGDLLFWFDAISGGHDVRYTKLLGRLDGIYQYRFIRRRDTK